MPPTHPKLQRWTDLLAALLRRHSAVPFEVLQKEVPAYAAHKGPLASLMRKFERDKDELRAFGVPIESQADEVENVRLYRLASRSFYLPYLHLVNDRRPIKRPKGIGYAALPTLAFEPDELAVVVAAARRVQSLGDPALAHEAASALRKIAHDLPVHDHDAGGELIVDEDALDGATLDDLARAVRGRKKITFTYYSMHRAESTERQVDPYGIVYVSGHWYLIGHDDGAGALRQYRVRRISALKLNAKAPHTADFDVPVTFKLWEYTKSRQSWELGDAEAHTVTVRFEKQQGHVVPAMRLGTAGARGKGQGAADRVFRVRRMDTFLLWILGFAGAARPVDPPGVIVEYDRLLRATLSVYGAEARGGRREAR